MKSVSVSVLSNIAVTAYTCEMRTPFLSVCALCMYVFVCAHVCVCVVDFVTLSMYARVDGVWKRPI